MSAQMASIHPSSTAMSDYMPTASAPTICKSQLAVASSAGFASTIPSTTIPIATNLPPTPNEHLCECMMKSLDCVAKQKFTPGSYWLNSEPLERRVAYTLERELVESACAQNASWCLGSETNTNTGQYGTFSVCNSTERGSWIMDQMYKGMKKNTTICTSIGGVLIPTADSTAQSDDCRTILAQAGPQGTGVVTYSSLSNGKRLMHGGLTSSEKIGLAIGIVLGVVFLAATILWLYRRKRTALSSEHNKEVGTDSFGKVELPVNPSSTDKNMVGKAELPYNPVSLNKKWASEVKEIEQVEIDGKEKFELDADMGYIELPTDYHTRVELEGSSVKVEKH
jgi:hypothetical protein